jgi:hypothetical protein
MIEMIQMIHRDGKVEKIILSIGGFKFLGIGEKLGALPYQSLKTIDLGLVYNVTMQQLKGLPEFNYPQMSNLSKRNS